MSKKKRRKQKSKSRYTASNIFDIMEMAKQGKTTFTDVEFTGRAQITGHDYGSSHHRKPLQYADLMYGKKLVMRGKNKGRII